MATGFDALAKKGTTATKKATAKIAATVTKEVAQKVDDLIVTKGKIKQLEGVKSGLELEIINHIRPQQDKLAYDGQYTNALEVSGAGAGKVLYITSDRFVVPQEEENINELRKVCGKKYDEFFEVKRIISVKESVIKEASGEKLQKICDACKKVGLDIAELFEVADKVVSKANLDSNQYELSKEKLAEFRTLVRQYKPALK